MKKTYRIVFLILLVCFAVSCSSNIVNKETTNDKDTMDTTKADDMIPVYDTEFSISVDFSEYDFGRTPYLKKFDMFASTWAWCNDFTDSPRLTQKNLDLVPDIAVLLPETVRTDLFMGYYGIGRNIGRNGLSATTDGEFALVKKVVDTLTENGLSAEFIYFASPEYTGGGIEGEAWKTVSDLNKWENLCSNIAGYFKNNGINVTRHEIWNEPDYFENGKGVFFNGSWQDYINLYIAGSRGIRKSNPDALVGGVSAAWIHETYKNGYYSSFLKQTCDAGLLPDYVSWHFYGSNGGMRMLEKYISAARKGLEESKNYSTVQQNLNEFNVDLDSKAVKSYKMVLLTLDAFNQLLDATDITRVTWTSALDRELDDAAALINPLTGARTPAYYTHWIYARLPSLPVEYVSDSQRVGVMAAKGDTRCGVIIYDRSMENTEITFNFKGIGFDSFNLTVYTVDSEKPQNRVTSDTPKILNSLKGLNGDIEYSLTIPANGAVYLEFDKCDSQPDAHERTSELSGNVVRTDYWYNGRDDGGAYALFGTKSLIVNIGSGSSEKSKGIATVATLDSMKDKILVFDTTLSDGIKKLSDDSMFGVTVSYAVDGKYEKTVYYALDGVDGNTDVPLGTKRLADITFSLGNGSGAYEIVLNSEAPENWDGRIQLGFVVNNVPHSCGAEYIINVK